MIKRKLSSCSGTVRSFLPMECRHLGLALELAASTHCACHVCAFPFSLYRPQLFMGKSDGWGITVQESADDAYCPYSCSSLGNHLYRAAIHPSLSLNVYQTVTTGCRTYLPCMLSCFGSSMHGPDLAFHNGYGTAALSLDGGRISSFIPTSEQQNFIFHIKQRQFTNTN